MVYFIEPHCALALNLVVLAVFGILFRCTWATGITPTRFSVTMQRFVKVVLLEIVSILVPLRRAEPNLAHIGQPKDSLPLQQLIPRASLPRGAPTTVAALGSLGEHICFSLAWIQRKHSLQLNHRRFASFGPWCPGNIHAHGWLT